VLTVSLSVKVVCMHKQGTGEVDRGTPFNSPFAFMSLHGMTDADL
jgi:hypothetical protein